MRYYRPVQKQMKIGPIITSEKEIRDIIKAWLAISAAFAIMISGSLFSQNLYLAFILSGLTVGIGFIFHEMGHKLVAQRYGCFAEFRAFNSMLLLAIGMAVLFRVVFAAPGAVMISGPVGVRRNGKISLAGPLMNFVIAVLLLGFLFLITGNIENSFKFINGILAGDILNVSLIFSIPAVGFFINVFLGLFNLIPIGNFDGKKILRWNRGVYAGMLIAGFVLMFSRGFFI